MVSFCIVLKSMVYPELLSSHRPRSSRGLHGGYGRFHVPKRTVHSANRIADRRSVALASRSSQHRPISHRITHRHELQHSGEQSSARRKSLKTVFLLNGSDRWLSIGPLARQQPLRQPRRIFGGGRTHASSDAIGCLRSLPSAIAETGSPAHPFMASRPALPPDHEQRPRLDDNIASMLLVRRQPARALQPEQRDAEAAEHRQISCCAPAFRDSRRCGATCGLRFRRCPAIARVSGSITQFSITMQHRQAGPTAPSLRPPPGPDRVSRCSGFDLDMPRPQARSSCKAPCPVASTSPRRRRSPITVAIRPRKS